MLNHSKMLLQNLQDSFSAYINMTLYMTDQDGSPMTNMSGISPFVELLVYKQKLPFLSQLKKIIVEYPTITTCVVIDVMGCPVYSGVKGLLVPVIIDEKIISYIWCWAYIEEGVSDYVKAGIKLDELKEDWKYPIYQLPVLTNKQLQQKKEQLINMASICSELLKSKRELELLNVEEHLLNAVKATNVHYYQLLEIMKKNENLDYAGIASLTDETVKIKAFIGPLEDSIIGCSFIKAGTFFEDVSSCKSMKYWEYIGFDPRLSFLMINGIRTGCFFCYPILINNQVGAFLFGGKTIENRLSPYSIRRIGIVGSIVEMGMNNEWLKTRIDLHLMKLSILMEISKSVTTIKNVQDMLLLMTNIANSLVPSHFTSITTKFGSFEFLNVTNIINDMTIKEYCQNLHDRTFKTEKTKATYRKSARILEKYETFMIECPIYIDDSLFGMISVSLLESIGFKEAEAYLNSLSSICGLALKPLLKKLKQKQIKSIEVEKEFIKSSPLMGLLTPRELEVLRLIVRGRSNKEIGDELYISKHTVKNHISNILNKLEVNDRRQIIAAFYSLNYKNF
ncbi:response regulator containing a CheY-like receiver domain and an HTH DNA-binding domain [Schinkia azotoformans MEV2011]|uniref:Response regulator containing a CheY-like receiver domain and an HTH DNA-binding domain n=1 Tax=Schinkia azotoformans MEV2011 TaxID=1348973 RepID=A0A072NT58_SCHAZ|nr:response regulator transcription factor [Schinkia azotoformans]KEF40058.1 response regulator containing a CheY-like receiver domain and an HTH DNA-binding domain [Schinkia azotoformans MEV2011]MEC1694754.1 response regulator transcription factor [Schinkia azotoformans]MEC1716884.1 response regulator transcription factor [Schinkia azotoformans]MEC1726437.1 response regulator transcription factor [Schinkia azotoformans]MEC1743166.1 response regulator transcription factor [Schinkia azotoforman